MKGLVEPGKHLKYDDSQTIDLENVPLDGGYLVKTLVLSVDPYMRARMREAHIPSYSVSALIVCLNSFLPSHVFFRTASV